MHGCTHIHTGTHTHTSYTVVYHHAWGTTYVCMYVYEATVYHHAWGTTYVCMYVYIYEATVYHHAWGGSHGRRPALAKAAAMSRWLRSDSMMPVHAAPWPGLLTREARDWAVNRPQQQVIPAMLDWIRNLSDLPMNSHCDWERERENNVYYASYTITAQDRRHRLLVTWFGKLVLAH
jgi:hypothetical protein